MNFELISETLEKAFPPIATAARPKPPFFKKSLLEDIVLHGVKIRQYKVSKKNSKFLSKVSILNNKFI